MLNSLRHLLESDYNKTHRLFALRRFFYWKMIRLFKLSNVKHKIWDNRKILLNSDSFHNMWLMYNYIVDWEEFNLIADFVKEGDLLADVGTNVGYYTIWMSKFIGKTGQIHSFEPDPVNFGRLAANVALNDLQAVVAINNIALAADDGYLLFTTNLDGQNHIDLSNTGDNVKIAAKRFDTYVTDHNISYLSYVKIDVEGFEYDVLKGAQGLLMTHKIGIIQLEINATIQNSNKKTTDIFDLLTAHNYTLCRYDVARKQLVETTYMVSRENYFAVHDLIAVNQQLFLAR